MWEEKHCFMEMFMTFYDMYRPPFGSYRDFLHNVLSVYETFIKGKQINQFSEESNTKPLRINQEKQESQMMMRSEEDQNQVHRDTEEWTPEEMKEEETDEAMDSRPPDSLAFTGADGGSGGPMGATPCSLLERAIFSQFAAAACFSSPSCLDPLSAAGGLSTPPPPLQPPPPALQQPPVVHDLEDDDDDEDEEEEEKNNLSLSLVLGPTSTSCQVCGWSCSSPSLLLHHAQRHAPNEARPHVCLECGRRFKRRDGLSRHLNIHRDLRPFPCPQCGQAFRLKQHLTRHLEARHSSPLAPPTMIPSSGAATMPDLGNEATVGLIESSLPPSSSSAPLPAALTMQCHLDSASKVAIKSSHSPPTSHAIAGPS